MFLLNIFKLAGIKKTKHMFVYMHKNVKTFLTSMFYAPHIHSIKQVTYC